MAVRALPATPRIPLTRERVLRAAIELADSAGVESLSMRRLGQALGVEAMSLYNHVRNKADILGGMLDVVTDEIELPVPGSGWKAALRTMAVSAHRVYLEHSWAASLTLTVSTGPGRFRYMEAILRSLREGGFSAEMAHHAYHALESHIVGFTLWVVGVRAGLAAIEDRLGDIVREMEAHYPYVAEHAGEHGREREPGERTEFEFGLDLILDGLDASQAGGPPRE